MPTVFFLGATGFVGGVVLVELQRNFPEFTFKALIRSESAISIFIDAGVPISPVKGTFADTDLITQLAAEADVVVNAADSDDVALKDSLLRGLRKHFDEGKGVGSLVHVSGTMIFADGNREGKFDPNGKVWTDNEEDVKLLTESRWHGKVDIPILKAQEEGFLNAYILVPSIIHGPSTGPAKTASLFFRYVVGDALVRKKVVYVGEGSSVSGAVNVQDFANLVTIAFEHLVDAKGSRLLSSPYERYVIASPEQYDYKTIASHLAAELYRLGKVETSEAVSMSYDEIGGIVPLITSQNSLMSPMRARSLGWAPKHGTLLETIRDDVQLF